MGEIQIYDKNSMEHIKLEMFARIMDSKTPSNYYFTVDDGFLIVVRDGNGHQFLLIAKLMK